MKPKNLFWLIIEFIFIFIFIGLFYKTFKTIGLSLDEFIIFALALYFFILVIIIFIGYSLITEISFFLSPIIQRIKKKLHKEKIKPIEKPKKKPKKKRLENIEPIYAPTTEEKETTGSILKQLGIKREKIKEPKEKKEIELKTKEIKEIPQRDLTNFIEQLNKKGFIEIKSDNIHLGKLRSHNILIYLKKELKKRGIKTKKVRKKLIKC